MAMQVGVESLVGDSHGAASELYQRAVVTSKKVIMLEFQRSWHFLQPVVINIAGYNLPATSRIASQIPTVPGVTLRSEICKGILHASVKSSRVTGVSRAKVR
jgi:hypothetical protein